MDLLKKMFSTKENSCNHNHNKGKKADFGNEFRKPIWYDDESDDELFDNNKSFGFQIFTNPLQLQKHYEHQMQEIIKSLADFEGSNQFFEKNPREDYIKPGFENIFAKEPEAKSNASMDSDLDGEIYPEQLHTLLQRISPEMNNLFPNRQLIQPQQEKKAAVQRKPTDEEKIWNQIHGNTADGGAASKSIAPFNGRKPQAPHGGGGIFDSAFQGPKIFSQSVMIQTVRKPDGSYETRRTVRDTDGQTKTTVTRSENGKTETITTIGGDEGIRSIDKGRNADAYPIMQTILGANRNLAVSTGGYLLPNNLW